MTLTLESPTAVEKNHAHPPPPHRPILPGIPNSQLRAVGIGQFVEWFDWAAYSLLAVYFANQFFPESAAGLTALLGSFGILAVGFIVRPLAGLVVGAIADRLGRRYALLITVYGMGIASLVMAVAPTYKDVGLLAPIIVLAARIIQGISIGGEFSTMAAFAMESAEEGKRGWVAGLVNFFGNLGQIALIGLITVLAFILTPEEMSAWGWRAVFLCGAIFALLGVFLRKNVEDTLNTDEKHTSVTLSSLLTPIFRFPQQSIQVIGLTAGFTAMVYTWGSYFPTYANTYHGFDLRYSLVALFTTYAVMSVFTPIAGILSDKLGRRTTMVVGGLALTVGTVPALGLLNDSLTRLLLIQLAGSAALALLQASSMPLYTELFPKQFRATGYGFPYSLTVGLIGGTIPMVGTHLASAGHPEAFPWYLVALMGVSTTFYLFIKETAFRPLPT